MIRVLGIELRRSAAIGTALTVLGIGALLLYFAEGIGFATGWMQLAMSQRLFLAVLWPLAMAAGAWQARREHRSNVTELFTSTPRPTGQRAVPILSAMAIAVVCGYLAMGVAGGLWIAGTAEYLPAQFFVVTAVGGLSLVAAAWLGLGVGRLLPWPATAPALAVAALGFLLSIPWATRPRGWLALVFSPMYEMNMPDDYATVPLRVSGSQTLWLAALALTGMLLFAAGERRTRMAAALPVVLGAALAVAVMPHQNRPVGDAIDPVARELVCAEDEPRVCVSRVHEGLLPELVPPAREALALLAKLPGGPTRVHEDTTVFGSPVVFPAARADTTLLRIDARQDGHLPDRATLLTEVVAGAFDSTYDCDADYAGMEERLAAAFWLIGREPVVTGRTDQDAIVPAPKPEPEDVASALTLWQSLRELPEDEARARVAALRQAALTCSVDGQLSGPGTK